LIVIKTFLLLKSTNIPQYLLIFMEVDGLCHLSSSLDSKGLYCSDTANG